MLLPHDAYHHDGTWKISLPLLLKNKQDTMRPDKWLASSQQKRSQYSSEVAEVCSEALLSGKLTTETEWITAFDALALLTYSSYNHVNRQLVEEIEGKTRLELPVRWQYSRYEQAFGSELQDLFSEWWSAGIRTHYQFVPQKHIERYFVDFLIIKQHMTKNGDTIKEFIVLEFDEAAHKRTDYRKRDEERDEWFRANKPNHKIIRVRHEHQVEWFRVVRKLGRLESLDACYSKCLLMASTSASKNRFELLINSDSSSVAYDQNVNDCSFLLEQPHRRLAEIKDILKQLEIEPTREDSKIVRFRRHDLEKRL